MLCGHSGALLPVLWFGRKVGFSYNTQSRRRCILIKLGIYRGATGKNHPWESRHAMVYWRGTTTGGLNEGTTYKSFHRHKMVHFASKKPDIYDIAFTDALQCEPKACESMRKEYRFVKNAPFEDNFKFKYLIDMVTNPFKFHGGSLIWRYTGWKHLLWQVLGLSFFWIAGVQGNYFLRNSQWLVGALCALYSSWNGLIRPWCQGEVGNGTRRRSEEDSHQCSKVCWAAIDTFATELLYISSILRVWQTCRSSTINTGLHAMCIDVLPKYRSVVFIRQTTMVCMATVSPEMIAKDVVSNAITLLLNL